MEENEEGTNQHVSSFFNLNGEMDEQTFDFQIQ